MHGAEIDVAVPRIRAPNADAGAVAVAVWFGVDGDTDAGRLELAADLTGVAAGATPAAQLARMMEIVTAIANVPDRLMCMIRETLGWELRLSPSFSKR